MKEEEIVLTPGLIENFYVSPLDTTAGKSPVKYQFTVIPTNKLAKGSYLVIRLPPEIEINDVYDLERGCRDQ